jgi:hypothetical protein
MSYCDLRIGTQCLDSLGCKLLMREWALCYGTLGCLIAFIYQIDLTIARTLLSISGRYDERCKFWSTKSLLLKSFFESLKNNIEGHWARCALSFSEFDGNLSSTPLDYTTATDNLKNKRKSTKKFQGAETLGLDTHVSSGIPYYSGSLLTVVLKSCVLYRRTQIVSRLISCR